jgi:sodium transport system ATP-binding protein
MIKVENLKKTFKLSRKQLKQREGDHSDGVIHAVDGIDFTCQPGRVFTLLGPNGAGKTTTLRIIATLMKPTSGTVTVSGLDVVKQSRQVRTKIGFLTGTTKLYERLTVDELVKYYADLHGMVNGAFEKRKRDLYDLLDMHSFAGWRIAKLSSGMRQKASIVRTIIHDPEVVVFDEPTVGLDVVTAKNIITLIRRCKEEGKTVIFSTHIMGEVSLLSDDLAILHQGKLLYNGTFQAFQGRMKTDSVEEAFIRILEEGQL